MERFPFHSVPIQNALLEINLRSLDNEEGGLHEISRWSRQWGLKTATINSSGLDDIFVRRRPWIAPDGPGNLEEEISYLMRGWNAGVHDTEHLPSVETKLTFSPTTKTDLDEWVVECTTMDQLVTRYRERSLATKSEEATP
jgi:hypothetical protein